MNEYFVVDMHTHVADSTVPSKIASKAADNPGIARVFRGIEMLQEEVGWEGGMVALEPTLEHHVRDMDELGIDVIAAAQLSFAYLLGGIEISPNAVIADAMRQHPGRILGIAGVDPHGGKEALRELERLVREEGFIGARVNPNDFGTFEFDDRELMYPFYEKCLELDIMLHCHTGVDPKFELWRNNPVYLDKVAHDFPRLRISAEHYGFPWAEEAYVMARYRDNVSLTLAWHFNTLVHNSPLLAWLELEKMRTYAGLENVMWGSDYPAAPNTAEVLDFLRNAHPSPAQLEMGIHDLTEEERAIILGLNAARMLGLEVPDERRAPQQPAKTPAAPQSELEWTAAAEEQIKASVPFFARKMARTGVERYAREHCITVITPEVATAAKGAAGIG